MMMMNGTPTHKLSGYNSDNTVTFGSQEVARQIQC